MREAVGGADAGSCTTSNEVNRPEESVKKRGRRVFAPVVSSQSADQAVRFRPLAFSNSSSRSRSDVFAYS